MRIDTENGELEFVPTPGYVKILASDGENLAELRATDADLAELRLAMEEQRNHDVHLENGVIGHDVGKGLYLEDYDGADMWLILSGENYEQLAEVMINTRALPS